MLTLGMSSQLKISAPFAAVGGYNVASAAAAQLEASVGEAINSLSEVNPVIDKF